MIFLDILLFKFLLYQILWYFSYYKLCTIAIMSTRLSTCNYYSIDDRTYQSCSIYLLAQHVPQRLNHDATSNLQPDHHKIDRIMGNRWSNKSTLPPRSRITSSRSIHLNKECVSGGCNQLGTNERWSSFVTSILNVQSRAILPFNSPFVTNDPENST